jgi:hypothetical protein
MWVLHDSKEPSRNGNSGLKVTYSILLIKKVELSGKWWSRAAFTKLYRAMALKSCTIGVEVASPLV